jgi:hypothetical protein
MISALRVSVILIAVNVKKISPLKTMIPVMTTISALKMTSVPTGFAKVPLSQIVYLLLVIQKSTEGEYVRSHHPLIPSITGLEDGDLPSPVVNMKNFASVPAVLLN